MQGSPLTGGRVWVLSAGSANASEQREPNLARRGTIEGDADLNHSIQGEDPC
jgi:hypothetical protein